MGVQHHLLLERLHRIAAMPPRKVVGCGLKGRFLRELRVTVWFMGALATNANNLGTNIGTWPQRTQRKRGSARQRRRKTGPSSNSLQYLALQLAVAFKEYVAKKPAPITTKLRTARLVSIFGRLLSSIIPAPTLSTRPYPLNRASRRPPRLHTIGPARTCRRGFDTRADAHGLRLAGMVAHRTREEEPAPASGQYARREENRAKLTCPVPYGNQETDEPTYAASDRQRQLLNERP